MVEVNWIRKYRVNVKEVVREDTVSYTYDEIEFNLDIPVEISDAKVAKMEAKIAEAEAKEIKNSKLDSITVEVNGKVFDGNEKARLNMLSVLQAASVIGLEHTYWKMANNSVIEVTVDELREALIKAIQEVGNILVG